MKDTAKTRRIRLAEKYGANCMKCGCPLHIEKYDKYYVEGVTRRAKSHHMVHRKNNGSDRLENLELRCLLCEMESHGMTITEKHRRLAYK